MSYNRELQLKSFYDAVTSGICESGRIKPPRKDNELARKLSLAGKEYVERGLFINAVDKFNESLCYLDPNSEEDKSLWNEISGDRRGAYLGIKNVKIINENNTGRGSNSTENVENGFSGTLPKAGELAEKPIQSNPPQLSLLKNPKIPFMAQCLELRTSDQFGRYIITTKDLRVGDIVMLERPTIAYLRSPMRYKRCANCLSGSHRHILIPCPHCTKAMYCSDKCLTDAWQDYHRLECRVSEYLDDLDGSEHLGRALRCLFLGVSINGGLKNLHEYLVDHGEDRTTPFDLDYTNRDRKKEFLVLYQMHFSDAQIRDRRFFMTLVAQWTRTLIDENVFEEELTGDLLLFVLNTLYRFTITSIMNSFGTTITLPLRRDHLPVSSNQHLVMTMFNHSCAPNITRFEAGTGERIVMVIRPIGKGEQLFGNYGRTFECSPSGERQALYSNQYGFDCLCPACENDYPLLEDLPETPELSPFEDLPKNQLKQMFEYLQENDRFYPCRQLISAYERMKEIYKDLFGVKAWEEEYHRFYCDDTEGDVGDLSDSD